jgi:hypothetical protein
MRASYGAFHSLGFAHFVQRQAAQGAVITGAAQDAAGAGEVVQDGLTFDGVGNVRDIFNWHKCLKGGPHPPAPSPNSG